MRTSNAALLVLLSFLIAPLAWANGGEARATNGEKAPNLSQMNLEQLRAARDARHARLYPSPVTVLQGEVRANPMDADARYNLVEELIAEGRLQEAQNQAKAGLEIHPYYAPLRLKLARLYEQTDDTDLAIREYRMIVTDHPRWVLARISYALLLERLDRRVEAVEQWNAIRERSEQTHVIQTATRHIEQLQ